MRWVTAVFNVLIFIISTSLAFAGEYHLKFVPSTSATISDLKWDETKDTREPLLQKREKPGEAPIYFVTIHGSYQNNESPLLYENEEIHQVAPGKFSIEVEVNGENQKFSLTQADALGKR